MSVYVPCMTHHPNHQDIKNQTLYLPCNFRFCYRTIIGMADGYCLSRTYIHVNFSG